MTIARYIMCNKKGMEEETSACGCLVVSPGCVDAAWWSSPLGDMIRAPLLSNDAILGWLTSQLTRQCFISFFRINVCLSSTSKATSQGSLTTPSFIWFIYKPCPCASPSSLTHLAVQGCIDRTKPLLTMRADQRQQHSLDAFQCLLRIRFYMLLGHDVKSTTELQTEGNEMTGASEIT